MTKHTGSTRGRPAPIYYSDENGTPCVSVPLDKPGDYAEIEADAYNHITEYIGCSAPWHMTLDGKGRQYVALNAPHVDGPTLGLIPVARLLPGVEGRSIRFATRNTKDLRKANLHIPKVDKGRHRDCGKLLKSVCDALAAKRKPKPE